MLNTWQHWSKKNRTFVCVHVRLYVYVETKKIYQFFYWLLFWLNIIFSTTIVLIRCQSKGKQLRQAVSTYSWWKGTYEFKTWLLISFLTSQLYFNYTFTFRTFTTSSLPSRKNVYMMPVEITVKKLLCIYWCKVSTQK